MGFYISVILPCYNVAEFLPQCMETLERQSIGIHNLELIFVDDASTDEGKTWECILNFEKKYPKNVVAIHLEENCCQGGARNAGLSYASADYVGFLDPDDWIEPDMYLQLYTKALQYQCDAVDCRTVMNYPNGIEAARPPVEDKFEALELSIVEGGGHWTDIFCSYGYGGGIVSGIYRKQIIAENGILFPEHMKYEDNYWQSVLLLYVKRFYHIGNDLYHYRQHEQSTVHQKNQMYHFDRLEIERMKVSKYKELGLFTKFYREIERDFLGLYYINTLLIMCKNFEQPFYDVFCEMTDEIRELFPDCGKNPYMRLQEFPESLVQLIDKPITEEEFDSICEEIRKYREKI